MFEEMTNGETFITGFCCGNTFNKETLLVTVVEGVEEVDDLAEDAVMI